MAKTNLLSMAYIQRLWTLLNQLTQIRLFNMTRVNMDVPNPKTRDATKYLFLGVRNVGILGTSSNKIPYYLWSLFLNFMVTIYLPIGFLLSFLLRLSAFSPSEFFTSLQISVNCMGCSLKLFVFLFLYRRLVVAQKYMDRLDARVEHEEDKLQIRKTIAYGNRSVVMFTTLFLCYASSTFLTAVVNGKPPYQLFNPFFEWSDNPKNFCVQALMEYAMIDLHCYQQALLDAYPIIYILIIRAHLHILTRRISKLGSDANMNNNERYEALVQCVLDHKNVMELYNIFCPVISGTMFVQFLIIGLILGITTIHIVLFANWLAIVSSLFYVASILAETFPCSYLANSLVDDSDGISLAIFHSQWPEEDPRYKQVIVFFLQHTQKSLILTAMKIFPITMNSNINVVKFAFSVYTVIKKMYLGKKLRDAVAAAEIELS